MFLAYATGKGRSLIDRELYLSKSWTSDRERCRAAAVPDEVELAAKTTPVTEMLGAPSMPVSPHRSWPPVRPTGGTTSSPSWCEQRRVGYVVPVPRSRTIPLSVDGDLMQTAVHAGPATSSPAPEQSSHRCIRPGTLRPGGDAGCWCVAGSHG